jgi:hypothetical protein
MGGHWLSGELAAAGALAKALVATSRAGETVSGVMLDSGSMDVRDFLSEMGVVVSRIALLKV